MLVALTTSSCWVAMPSSGTTATARFHSKTIQVDRAFDVVNLFGSNIAWEHPSKDEIGVNQKVLATIPAGTLLEGKRTTLRRMPAGETKSLVCYSDDYDITFQISEKQLREWNATFRNQNGEQVSGGNGGQRR